MRKSTNVVFVLIVPCNACTSVRESKLSNVLYTNVFGSLPNVSFSPISFLFPVCPAWTTSRDVAVVVIFCTYFLLSFKAKHYIYIKTNTKENICRRKAKEKMKTMLQHVCKHFIYNVWSVPTNAHSLQMAAVKQQQCAQCSPDVSVCRDADGVMDGESRVLA